MCQEKNIALYVLKCKIGKAFYWMSKADSQLMHMMCSHLGKETKANLVERLLKEFILDLARM